jgi:hypothetical protein
MSDYPVKLINIIYLIDIYQLKTHYLSIMQVVNSTKFVNKITEAFCNLLTKSNLTLYFMKIAIKIIMIFSVAGFVLASCEGPQGQPGKDANESCTECHSPDVVDAVATQFELSKHSYGEAAFEEAGNSTCAPCHESEGFRYACQNNLASTFTLNSSTGKYVNDYIVPSDKAYGDIGCFTCHSSLHTTYTVDDFFPLTTTAPVSMTMWKGTKTIDLAQDGGMSNLCVKCHQPRPMSTSSTLSDGNTVDYLALASNPATVYYDNTIGNAAPNKLVPSYRTHVHYGTVGAIFAGKGGVEFTGTMTYQNSTHTTAASCQDCHMAAISGKSGGHSFTAEGNFKSCNTTGCHTSAITSSSTTFWKTTRDEIKLLLDGLASKINAVGVGTNILHSQSDAEENLWAGHTSGNWDGYLNIYDANSNPSGVWKNPAPSNSWTTAQKATNNALPAFPSLKNVVLGSMINFQFCLREYSLGIHNYKYTKALLQNSLEAMTAAGY